MRRLILPVILACLFSSVVLGDDDSPILMFNTTVDLHKQFDSAPELSAGYIQGVMDTESIEAFAANNNGESAWHVCISKNPKLQTAPLISQLVDRWYLDNPKDADMPAALIIVQAVNKECGIDGAHTGVMPKMGLPSTGKEQSKKPDLKMGLPRT